MYNLCHHIQLTIDSTVFATDTTAVAAAATILFCETRLTWFELILGSLIFIIWIEERNNTFYIDIIVEPTPTD